ncbi:G-type lectin S-receptor-like serine/threonine-protein kinase SD2-5 [Hevea brasiliensis]|nr:G-type lectin S-receptor-like serine/threonine-protein kinase SD2-5 [Hevea brasiliensis]
MKMMETGNLVLHDGYNNTIWQSFDHPMDKLLSGQKLLAGQKLVASISKTNVSEGDYSVSLTSKGLVAFYDEIMYFSLYFPDFFPEIQTVESIELTVNGTFGVYALTREGLKLLFPFPRFSNYTRMKYDSKGHLRLYDHNSKSADMLRDHVNECDYPTSCGNYGLCSNGRCSCPAGFAQDNVSKAQGYFRCNEVNPTACGNPLSHSLLSYENVHYFNYSAGIVKVTDMASCKQSCLKNCSCKVALFRYNNNFSYGECLWPSPVLSLINERTDRYYSSFPFIKISNDVGSGRGSIHTRTIAGIITGTILLVGLIVGLSWILYFRKNRDGEDEMEDYLDKLSGLPKRFTYQELRVATNDFQKKLGKGGFGSVFEGNTTVGEKIAVKRLDALGQGKKEFLAEVKTIGSIHHNNLVRLIGFCAEKLQRLLVYEFMCNGSLDKWIFHEPLKHSLDWQIRKTIILDIAKGLAYLHEDCRQKIVHLDIKPQNILLDADLHAKISDFGLSKLIDRNQSQVLTTIRGTVGYLAPEWFSSIITEKVDVYSFGIVVMEVVCGRKNLDSSQPEECMHLLPIFMQKAKQDQLIDMVDRSNEDMQLHKSEVVEMMKVAIWCLQSNYTRRPSMSKVVKVLEGNMDVEADLDYSIHNATTTTAIRKAAEQATTAPLSPFILSGPR